MNETKLTEREKVVFIAEKLMDWTIPAGCSDWYTAKKVSRTGRERRAGMDWNPYYSATDAFRAVEKMWGKGWRLASLIEEPRGSTYRWSARFVKGNKSEPHYADTPAAAIADAIVAALDEVPGVFGPGGRE